MEPIFATLCDCAAKNPDPGQSDDEQDGDFFYDEDEVPHIPVVSAVRHICIVCICSSKDRICTLFSKPCFSTAPVGLVLALPCYTVVPEQ